MEIKDYIQAIYDKHGIDEDFDDEEDYSESGDENASVTIEKPISNTDIKPPMVGLVMYYGYYGSISGVINDITKGMVENYPDIDWEFHYYEWYGEVCEQIWGYDGGVQYKGAYEIVPAFYSRGNGDRRYIDGVQDDYDFSVPEPMPENPYPCPEYVPGERNSPDEYDIFWINPAFREN